MLTYYTPEQIMAFAALVSIIISAGVGLVALRTLGQLRNTTTLSERTVNQLQESTELSKNIFQLSNRPYIGIVHQQKTYNQRNGDFKLDMQIINHGKLPAIIESIKTEVSDYISGKNLISTPDERETVIFPDQAKMVDPKISNYGQNNEHLDVKVICTIKYRDANKNDYSYQIQYRVDVNSYAIEPEDTVKFMSENFS